MKIFLYELNKVFVKQKAIIFILIALCMKVLFLTSANSYSIETTNQNKLFYKQYLLHVAGKLTPDKEAYIQNEEAQINKTNGEKSEITNTYLKEQISSSEYVLKITDINNKLIKSDAFKILYDQYKYIKEEPENRYFLYTNGWTNLISHENPDMILILLILLIITPIFTNEYEKDMISLILTSKNGKVIIPLYKVIVASLVTVLLVISFSLIEFTFCTIKYGLPSGSFPIQSIVFLSTSKYHLSLMEAYLLICLLRIIGFLVFTYLIIFISSISKKAVPTLFSSLFITIIPYFLYVNSSIKYKLPLPIGFMIGTGYLRGSDVITQSVKNITPFIEVSRQAFIYQFVCMLILCLIFVIGAILIFSKLKYTRRSKSL